MALKKDIAIVLRRLDYSETSQILVMFTHLHGQQRLIAKGIKRGTKKRVAVGIDLLELGSLVFSARAGKEDSLAVLTEWRQVDNFSHLRRDLPKCYAAQYAAEVTSHLTEIHDPHPALFDGLRQLLSQLREGNVVTSLVEYLWLMLREIGLRPELAYCVNCKRDTARDPILFFSSRQGGAICRDCEPAMIEKIRLDAEMAQWLSSEDHDIAAQAPAAFELIDYHLQELMARPAKLSIPLRDSLGMTSQAIKGRGERINPKRL